MIELNKIYNEDCRETMNKMSDAFIDLTVTSPPYDSLREYNNDIKWNFDVFKEIANELYRVTKKGGVVVWVVGDQTIKGSESGTSFRQALYFKEIGFRLHDTMIYEKANFSMPAKNRYHSIFEYMFVFSKSKPKTFNPIKDRKNKGAGSTCFGKNTVRLKNGKMKEIGGEDKVVNKYGMRFNIWRMNTVGQENVCKSLPHPAMFPQVLAKDHIISWSNKNDLVYDPFMGSGTSAKMAIVTNRKYIGSEISKEYYKDSIEMLENVLPLFKKDLG